MVQMCSAPEEAHPLVQAAIERPLGILESLMYRVPLRASGAIASGVALVSLFGAAIPAMAKGGDRAPEAPASVAFECVDPASTPVATPETPTATPETPTATPETPTATPEAADAATNDAGGAGCGAGRLPPG